MLKDSHKEIERSMGDFLDLRKGCYHLGESGIFSAATRKQAVAFAKSKGWPQTHILKAANRFSAFWIIGQSLGVEDFVFLKRDGSTVTLPWPGWWVVS